VSNLAIRDDASWLCSEDSDPPGAEICERGITPYDVFHVRCCSSCEMLVCIFFTLEVRGRFGSGRVATEKLSGRLRLGVVRKRPDSLTIKGPSVL
jgi:hypothetical protein